MRAGVAWFALLALALPGFAAMRGFCCEPGLTKGSDCCASAMKMPGMECSQMESTMGAAVSADHRVAITPTLCAPVPGSEFPGFLVQSEGTFDGRLLLTQDFHPWLTSNLDADLFSSGNAAVPLIEETPPRLLLSDPLSIVLRI
jgi:hypothetical protein